MLISLKRVHIEDLTELVFVSFWFLTVLPILRRRWRFWHGTSCSECVLEQVSQGFIDWEDWADLWLVSDCLEGSRGMHVPLGKGLCWGCAHSCAALSALLGDWLSCSFCSRWQGWAEGRWWSPPMRVLWRRSPSWSGSLVSLPVGESRGSPLLPPSCWTRSPFSLLMMRSWVGDGVGVGSVGMRMLGLGRW